MTNSRTDWLRSPWTVALMTGALMVSLVLAASFLLINHRNADPLSGVGNPLTDGQATGQVLESAKQIVASAKLQEPSGSSSFVSCRNANEPPYQATMYMSFRLPTDSVKYLADVAAAMTTHGWTESPSAGEHFGRKLTKDGVAAVFYRNPDQPDFAIMRLYGECRNVTDHRNDNPVWTELTPALR